MPRPYPRIRGHYLHIIFKGVFQFFSPVEIVLENTGGTTVPEIIVNQNRKRIKLRNYFHYCSSEYLFHLLAYLPKKNLIRKYKQLQFYL